MNIESKARHIRCDPEARGPNNILLDCEAHKTKSKYPALPFVLSAWHPHNMQLLFHIRCNVFLSFVIKFFTILYTIS